VTDVNPPASLPNPPRVTPHVWAALPLVGDKLQGVVRYDSFDPNGSLTGDQTRSWPVGTNYYIRGHDLKLPPPGRPVRPAGTVAEWLRLCIP
jgi:hypothetical protein